MTIHTKNKKTILKSIQEDIKYGLDVSSVSGVSHISYEDRRTTLERLFWILIILLMAGLAASQGLQVLTHYNERPVIVTVDKSFFEWKLTFPTVTVCFRDLKSQYELDRIINTLVKTLNLSEEILTTEKDEFVEYLNDLAFKDFNSYEDYGSYALGSKKEYLMPDQYMEVLDQVVWFLQLPDPKKQRPSIAPVIFPFNQRRPLFRIFTEIGPCVTINPEVGIYFTPGYFNSSDPYYGYKKIHYTKNVMASMSIKSQENVNTYVYFHASNEVMEINDKITRITGHYFKQARYDTKVVTLSEDVKPLSIKQKNCRLPYESNEKPLEHSPVYSYNLCKFECRIEIALRYCNCTPYYYRRLEGERICNMTGMYCLSQYKDMMINLESTNKVSCPPCPQNCELSIFKENEVLQDLPYPLFTILEMFIMFPDTIYVRNLIFSRTDLLVQVGGIFSLFLGCSLLSFVEIGYYLTLRFFCGARSRRTEDKHRLS